MKVYVTTAGEYGITNVFLKQEDAEAYAGNDGGVEEHEVREKPVERRRWHVFCWNADLPDAGPSPGRMGNPWGFSDLREFDDNPRRVEHAWQEERAVSDAGPFSMRVLCVKGWDRDRVIEVYSEQRAQELASREGIS